MNKEKLTREEKFKRRRTGKFARDEQTGKVWELEG